VGANLVATFESTGRRKREGVFDDRIFCVQRRDVSPVLAADIQEEALENLTRRS